VSADAHKEECDVAVVGGGPAGCAAAIILARQGLRVVLVERSHYDEPRIGEIFPGAIQCELVKLGVWEAFRAAGHLQSTGMRCLWGNSSASSRSHLTDPYGHAWHVDRSAFDASLARAVEGNGAVVLLGYHVRGSEIEATASPAGWQIRASSATQVVKIRTPVIIDATGRRSVVARRLGASRRRTDSMVAVYRYFRNVSSTLDASSIVQAIREGWWYAASLPGERMIVALMTDADLAKGITGGDAREWERHLGEATLIHRHLANAVVESAARVAAASSSVLAPAHGPGWYAVGDAAMALDPLTGDGVTRALRSGMELARQVLDARANDPPFGLSAYHFSTAFERYLKERDYLYEREWRWRDAPFWSRRRARTVEPRAAQPSAHLASLNNLAFDCMPKA
jgi:flavin-dependent dehydrogenase